MRKETNITALEKRRTYSAIQKFMADHDEKAFSNPPKTDHGNNDAIEGDEISETPVPEVRRMVHSKSLAMFPIPKKSGIEAALSQFDVTGQKKKIQFRKLDI